MLVLCPTFPLPGVCGEHSPGSASTERTAALNPAVLRSRSHSPVRTAPARGSRSSCASSRQVLLPPSLPATSSLAAEPRFLCALPPTKAEGKGDNHAICVVPTVFGSLEGRVLKLLQHFCAAENATHPPTRASKHHLQGLVSCASGA
eukprot:g11296.t1